MPKKFEDEDKKEGLRSEPYSPNEAKRKIVQILNEGSTVFSRHLLLDIDRNRRGVSHQDVLHILQTGEIISRAEWDELHQNWKYKVEGIDLDDEELRAITIIIEEEFCLFIVTAY